MFHLLYFTNGDSPFYYLLDDERMECNREYALAPSEALDSPTTAYSSGSMVDRLVHGTYEESDGKLLLSFNTRPTDLSPKSYPELYL